MDEQLCLSSETFKMGTVSYTSKKGNFLARVLCMVIVNLKGSRGRIFSPQFTKAFLFAHICAGNAINTTEKTAFGVIVRSSLPPPNLIQLICLDRCELCNRKNTKDAKSQFQRSHRANFIVYILFIETKMTLMTTTLSGKKAFLLII